jgi:hypothetical protein
MQDTDVQAYQILVHDDRSHGWGGIKETAARPYLRDRARTCEIFDTYSQSTHQVTFNLDCNRVYLQKIGKVAGCRDLSIEFDLGSNT